MSAIESVLSKADEELVVIQISRSRNRERVFQALLHAKDGLICDEIERITRLPHQTVWARLKELRDSRAVIRTGAIRATRYKKAAWVHAVSKEAARAHARLKKRRLA